MELRVAFPIGVPVVSHRVGIFIRDTQSVVSAAVTTHAAVLVPLLSGLITKLPKNDSTRGLDYMTSDERPSNLNGVQALDSIKHLLLLAFLAAFLKKEGG